MACIAFDGKLTESGRKMLLALQKGMRSPEEIAKDTGFPLFRVRNGLSELTEASLTVQEGECECYQLTGKGAALL